MNLKRKRKKSKKEAMSKKIRIHLNDSEIQLISRFGDQFMGLGKRDSTRLDDLNGELSNILRVMMSIAFSGDGKRLVAYERLNQQANLNYHVGKIATNIGQINRKMEGVYWLYDVLTILDTSIRAIFDREDYIKLTVDELAVGQGKGKDVYIRVSYAIWKKLMNNRGVGSCSDVVKQLILSSAELVKIIPPFEVSYIAEIKSYIETLGGIINRIAHRLNAGEHVMVEELAFADPNLIEEDIRKSWSKKSLLDRQAKMLNVFADRQAEKEKRQSIIREASGQVYSYCGQIYFLLILGNKVRLFEYGEVMANSDVYTLEFEMDINTFDLKEFVHYNTAIYVKFFKINFGQKLRMVQSQTESIVYALYGKVYQGKYSIAVYSPDYDDFIWIESEGQRFYLDNAIVNLYFA